MKLATGARPAIRRGLAVALALGVAAFALSASAGVKSGGAKAKFKLAPRIAQKVAQGKTLNIVLSMQGPTIPNYGIQYQNGFSRGVKEATTSYLAKLNGRMIGPLQPGNAVEAINQIRSLLAGDKIDCLAIEPGSQPAYVPIVNQMISRGIPVFTVGSDLPQSKRLGTFITNWLAEGKAAAREVQRFFKAKGIKLQEAAMLTGAIEQIWAQQRLTGFYTGLKGTGTHLVNTPKSALDTGFDPANVYSSASAFLKGHPETQVLYQTDVSADILDKAIVDSGRRGKTFAIGHNVSLSILAAIKNGTQIATIDQGWPDQAAWGAQACAALLTKGQLLPNTNVSVVINRSNVDQARVKFLRDTRK